MRSDACQSEEKRDIDELEFNEQGALLRRSHTNPDDSHWTVHYAFKYQSGRPESVRQICDSVTQCVSEYDGEGRLRRILGLSGGTSRCLEEFSYNATGNKTRKQYFDISEQPDRQTFVGIQVADTYFSAAGSARIETTYNEREQPCEARFYDAAGQVLSHVTFKYDSDFRVIEELQIRSAEALARQFGEMPPDLCSVLQGLIEPLRIVHRYDESGCRVESRRNFGSLGEESTTRSYNVHGDKIGEVSEERKREFAPDDEGQVSALPGSERVTRSEARFQYTYDHSGNWTRKTIEIRSSEADEFVISSIEQRWIEYFR